MSGLVNADVYKAQNRTLVSTTIATKQLAVYASPTGGTQQKASSPRDNASRR